MQFLTCFVWVSFCLALPLRTLPAAAQDAAPADWRVLFLAGVPDAHPRGTHEYEASCNLLAHALTHAPGIGVVDVEIAHGGWPAEASSLHAADTIVVITAGADQDRAMHPLLAKERWSALQREMARGCGLVIVHWSTFVPREPEGADLLEWVGAHFDYESGPAPRHWASAIQTCDAQVERASAEHPVLRGVTPFKHREEWYYRLRSADGASGYAPLLQAQIPGEAELQMVACAREREGGGRGVATSGGHFLSNFSEPSFARFLLNAIVWTAQREVPPQGVATQEAERIEAWVIGGDQHPAHPVAETNQALVDSLRRDPRFDVRVVTDLEALSTMKPGAPHVAIWNHCNWTSGGPSSSARENFESWLASGGGVLLLHFGNSAFHPSLPTALPDHVWPFWHAQVSRRAWDHHGHSGHDAYGSFQVALTENEHPVTRGLRAWNTTDELYYRQVGAQPITPLLVARSLDTNRNEPLAWSHTYQRGRIFQTLLGHDVASLRNPGTATLVRRAATWCAKRELRPELDGSDRIEIEGPRGSCLDGRAGRVQSDFDAALARPPFTVDALVRLPRVAGHQVFVSRETKESGTHWELYADEQGGVLSVYLPGYEPAVLRSDAAVSDDQWHAIAMQFDGTTVVLYVDAREVLRSSVQRNDRASIAGPLWFAGAVAATHEVGCAAWLDEVRLRRGVQTPMPFDSTAVEDDATLLGSWSFDPRAEEFSAHTPAEFISPAAWTPPYREGDPESEREEDWIDARFQRMDTGPFFTTAVETDRGRVARGLALRLGREREASMLFDLSRLEMRAAWRGRFLEHSAVRFGLLVLPKIAAAAQFSTAAGSHLLLDPEEGRWRGLELRGERVLLDYERHGRRIAEAPWTTDHSQLLIYERRFEIDAGDAACEFLLDDEELNEWTPLELGPALRGLAWERAGEVRAHLLMGSDVATLLATERGRILRVPASDQSLGVAVWSWRGDRAAWERVRALALSADLRFDLRAEWRAASAPRWHPIATRGEVGKADGAFALDTVTLPFENPWGALLFTSGVAFLPNGDGVVCTAHGDVWIVSGLDASLDQVTWRRFATGLYQPLGVVVRDGEIFVLGRDQLTHLIDRDQDGEADRYENHCNLLEDRGESHAYAMDLELDAAGNFYFQKSGGNGTAHGSSTLRIAADGQSIGVLAHGFRHANGLGVGPEGQITNADNQGDWIPATRINWLYKDAFYGGYVPGYRGAGDAQAYDPPLCWIPHAIDNSAGGQVWVKDARSGWPEHALLHTSFGRCRIYLVLHELADEASGLHQGGVIPLPPTFASGVCRARFHPLDGALYVVGLEGWQTAALQDGCLQRLRRTSQALGLAIAMHTTADGVVLEFDDPLDPASVQATAFEVERWNYRYSASYGSDEYSLLDPEHRGRDPVLVRGATLAADQRTVTVQLESLVAVMQQRVAWKLRAADGTPITGELFHTVHRVPQ